jgi:hypothetical protein
VAVAHVLAAVALGVRARAVGLPVGLGTLGLAALALLTARVGRTGPAVRGALALGAWALAGLGGWALAGGPPGAAGIAAAAAGASAVAAAAVTVVPAVAPGAAVAGLGLLLGGLAAAGGAPLDRVAGLAALLGLLALRVLPAVVASRLRPGAGDLQGLARRARRRLASLTAGVAAILLGAALVLVSTGGPLGLALAAVVGLGLLLRSLSYRFAADALPPALAAGGCLLGLEVAVGVQAVAHGWAAVGLALPLITGALVLLPGVLGRERPEVPPAWWLAVEVPVVPLVLAQWGVWGSLVAVGRHLLG